jgi:CheY-like chemotaxis protein/HPt (histidine-containing phosphotransfer) domain-containing protein
VDDNATNRRILEEMLANWRMKPAAAEGGEAALAAMERARDAGEPFALVLLDAMMPGMDGFALAEAIRQRPRLVGATLMMLSSAGQSGDAARCRELGVAAYLTKPIKQSDLLDTLMQVRDAELGLQRSEAESRPGAGIAAPRAPIARSLHILLAEDIPVNQKLAVRTLERWGHTVVVAGDGKVALAALERAAAPDERPFDLVLMDVQMPEMGGFDATAAIRAREAQTGGHLPIIAMTAHAMKGDRERCLEAGMDGYVSKPIQAAALLAAIEEMLPLLPARSTDTPGVPPPAVPKSEAGAPPEVAEGEVLDKAELLKRVEDDMDLLGELAALFGESCPKQLAAVRAAIAERDAAALERAAHAIKGSVGNFAARSPFEAALRLELMGHEGELTGAEETCAVLEEALVALKEALGELLSSPRAG